MCSVTCFSDVIADLDQNESTWKCRTSGRSLQVPVHLSKCFRGSFAVAQWCDVLG